MILKNEYLTVKVTDCGAVIESIQKDGKEFFWQKDASAWDMSDLVMFPFVARLPEKTYYLDGKAYELPIHGFCVGTPFVVEEKTDEKVVFSLTDTEETRKMYPFKFRLFVEYALEGDALVKRYRVENMGEETMYFGIGSHPGLCLPDAPFSAWKLSFSGCCSPKQQLVDQETLMLAGGEKEFSLENGREISLSHELFKEDVLIFTDTTGEVTLYSEASQHKVTVQYPDCPYIGFWQKPVETADYVCIEPWYSLPAVAGEKVDFKKKPDLLSLAPGKTYENVMRIIPQ